MATTKAIKFYNGQSYFLPVTRGSLVQMYNGESADTALEHINSYFPIKIGNVVTLTPEEKVVTEGDTVDQTFVNMSYVIRSNEKVTAAALNDLYGRTYDVQGDVDNLYININNLQDAIDNMSVDLIIGDISGLTPEEKVVTQGDTIDQTFINMAYIIDNNETVTAAALSNLDERITANDIDITEIKTTLEGIQPCTLSFEEAIVGEHYPTSTVPDLTIVGDNTVPN